MTASEKKLLASIESITWTSKKGTYINANTPKTFVSRDSRAMAQGIRLPAHLHYDAIAFDCEEQCKDVEELLSTAERFLRQVEARLSAGQTGSAPPTIAIEAVRTICTRFHLIARQLSRRHERRATLTITDEYDVQDLLHAQLRLHFDDVRPEEWTPSYAGGSARMDFLLKNEGIVIEVKMTRVGLSERQVSEQLIVDIARYRTHPDCKRLVCFVCDPEAHIRNPRGVEADLTKLSSADLEVTVIIAP
jgi:REase_DpnII-MboI